MRNSLCLLVLFTCQYLFCQEKITLGSGTEDMVLDTLHDRLLISCDQRRDSTNTIEGDIWGYEFSSGKKYKLKRIQEPKEFIFNPHGIFLFQENDSSFLFVVNHYDKPQKSEILRYFINDSILVFEARIPYNSKINSVTALSKNCLYFSNDKYFNGNLIRWKNGEFTTVDSHIKYPNGVNIKDSILYLSTTIGKKIYAYKLDKNGDATYYKTIVKKIKGLDNIRFHQNSIITTSHPKFSKFIKHYKNAEKISPSVVYSIDLTTGESTILYKNNGEMISAASTGIIYNKFLYISQVFDDFILKVPLDLK